MSLSPMESDPEGTAERARSALESVRGAFDAALARTRDGGEEQRA